MLRRLSPGALASDLLMLDLPTPVAVADLSARERFWFSGADAPAFLNRLLTLDTIRLPPGQGDRAFLLDARGRVEAALRLFRLHERRFLADCAPGAGAALVAALERYHFGEDFTIQPGPTAALVVFAEGPRGAEAVSAALSHAELPRPAPGGVQATEAGWWLGAERTGPGASVDFWCDAADLIAASRATLLPWAPPEALERARILAGVGAWGAEYGPHATPLDVHPRRGLTDGKGCYPGQEVIERTLALGRPAQALVGLWIEGPAAAGDEVRVAEAAVGRLTSVAGLPDGRHAALALLKRRALEAPELSVQTAAGLQIASRRPLAVEEPE